MCGIHGVFHYRDGVPDRDVLERMGRAQRHRGPDDSGLWVEGPCALGHRRLAIVDLSPGGHQPLAAEEEDLWVVFNGELYNWPEVRSLLVARGHRFRGQSDTEMLLHLWQEKGQAMLEDLRGMFAFALFDVSRRRLLLARDRVGKKPLFYHDDGRRIVFASELKCLLQDPSVPRVVDPHAIADYLTYQYVPSPGSIWTGVRKLPAGHSLIADREGTRVERYWRLPSGVRSTLTPTGAIEGLRDVLREAVRIRLMSDVPLGAFLSGGIDSSAIVALMTQVSGERVRTFSIGFEEAEYSELSHASDVARHLGTEHTELIVRPQALELLPKLVWGMDEPFADASMIPAFHVAEMARHHVTVALSGDGGDEACAGYDTYDWARTYARMDVVPRLFRRCLALPSRWLPPEHALGRKLHRIGLDVGQRHLEVMSHFTPRERDAVLSQRLREATRGHDPYREPLAMHARAALAVGPIPALAHLDALTYMTDDVLAKVDRTSMMSSLEVRSPILDHRVLEFLAGLPYEYKVRDGTRKWVLREAVRPWLPPSILARGKQGFGVPLGRWFGGRLRSFARDILFDPRTRERDWFDAAGVDRVIRRLDVDAERAGRQVFTLICLELWARTYVDRERSQSSEPADGPMRLHPAVRSSASA